MHRYRSDIDGLRGIAILVVVLFHARVPGFQGGYIGVDVFFVISGFLITSILLERGDRQRGLTWFYERRIRRLFPALFMVLICCAGIAAFVSLPDELDRFGVGMAATALFSSNIFFWRQAGYFSPLTEYEPLLHMWSLGVEEQFYVFYPVALVTLRRYFSKYMVTVTAALAVISFALSIWGVENYPSATFYLAPTRAWEFLLGALTFMKTIPEATSTSVRQYCAWIGIGLITFGTVTFSPETDFPGLAALVPCAGTVLIIYSGVETTPFVNRLLSVKPLVFLGLISYSLYLWHWPLLAFSRSYAIRPLDWPQTLMVIMLALVISILSWRYVERPFRRTGGVLRRTGVIRGGVLLTVTATLLGGVFALSDGFPQRFSPTVRVLAQGAQDQNPDRQSCHSPKPAQVRAGDLCSVGADFSNEPDFIVWGDSHADAMMPVFKSIAQTLDNSGLIASYTSCPPLIGIELANHSDSKECTDFNEAVLSVIEQFDSVTVFLIANWQSYAKPGALVENQVGLSADRDGETAFARSLNRTLRLASKMDRKIWLVQQVPAMKYDPARSLARAASRSIDREFLQLPVIDHINSTSGLNAVFSDASTKYDLGLINPQDLLCDETYCRIEHDGRSLYRAYGHLSTFGAHFLGPALEVILADFDPAE